MSLLSSGEDAKLRTLLYSPVALSQELSRLSGVHRLSNQAPPSAAVPPSSFLSKTIMSLCITRKKADMSLSMDLLLALMRGTEKQIWRHGVSEMCERCVSEGFLDEAVMVLRSVCAPAGVLLDLQTAERLVAKLAEECRIDDLSLVLLKLPGVFPAPTHNILAVVAEPFVLSGELRTFSTLFERFLDPKDSGNTRPPSEQVSHVLRALMLARARRQLSSAIASDADTVGLALVVSALDEYHMALPKQELLERCSYFHFRQLLEMEGLQLSSPDLPEPTVESKFCMQLTPNLSMSGTFPYVSEDRLLDCTESAGSAGQWAPNDLSSELASGSPSRPLLLTASLFPSAYEHEARLLRKRSASSEQLVQTMLLGTLLPRLGMGMTVVQQQEGSEGDEGDEEDEDEDDGEDDEGEDDDDDDEYQFENGDDYEVIEVHLNAEEDDAGDGRMSMSKDENELSAAQGRGGAAGSDEAGRSLTAAFQNRKQHLDIHSDMQSLGQSRRSSLN